MMLEGLTVSRLIPKDTLLGLVTGAYKLHGGVVRDMGGRIVAHLAMPASSAMSLMPGLGWISEAFQTYQLQQLGLSLSRVETTLGAVFKLSAAATATAGLGVVVSVLGFAFLNRKLGELDARLGRIEQLARKTNRLLEAMQHGQLKAAMDNLRHASETRDPRTRSDLLLLSKDQFGQLTHQYARLWRDATTLEELRAVDESHWLAMVGHALATSELGMGRAAAADFAAHRADWRHAARQYVQLRVLRDNPERLLHHRYVGTLPAADLVDLLDFCDNNTRGIARVDELRVRAAQASILQLPSFDDEAELLSLARSLTAKDAQLDSFEAHLTYLADLDMSALAFQRRVDELRRDIDADEPVWIHQVQAVTQVQPADHREGLPDSSVQRTKPPLLRRMLQSLGLSKPAHSTSAN